MNRSAVYHVLAEYAPSRHIRRVDIFYWDVNHFQVEAFQPHRINVTSSQMAYGGRRLFIVRCYIAPDDALTIKHVVEAIRQNPLRAVLLVAGNFNADLAALEGNRCIEEIAVDIVTAGLEDMYTHFLLHCKV